MKKYINIFLKRKLILIIIFFMTIITSLLGIISTYFNGIFIDGLVEATHISDIYVVLVLFFIIVILGIIFKFLFSLIIPQAKEKYIYDFKLQILNSKKYPHKENIPYLSKRIDEDTRQITNFFIDNFSIALVKVLEVIIVSFLVFSINWQIGIIMLIVCPIYFGLYTVFKKPIFNISMIFREKSARFFGDYATELEKEFLEDSFIKSSFASYLKKYRNYILISSGLSSSQGLIVGLVQVIVFFIGGISVINGYTTIGLLSITTMYFNQVISNITYYLDLGRKWQVTSVSIKRIDEILN